MCTKSSAFEPRKQPLTRGVLFPMSERSLGCRLFYGRRPTETLDISEVFYFEAARWTRRLAVKLVVEDVLFQLFETDHFGEKTPPY
ncbi:hypothetical protein ALC56_11394 [Trachymyrmex septentrionalis]|uniref:Uncharacterized protein n=1 Tax=Trachymyrmex septentrionalis TaxID=34720 RepID=A0A195F285_9HYME|nr:hypothetical protein ALC56_11394 [Trachymyrmex septentrionalis]